MIWSAQSGSRNEKQTVRVLMIGDIVGSTGLDACLRALPGLKIDYEPDFIIANGENCAGGRGISPDQSRRLLNAGIDVITLGNHAWDKSDIIAYLDKDPRVIRPLNYPPGAPGAGFGFYTASNGAVVGVVSLLGRALMDPVDDPFRAADVFIAEAARRNANVLIVDIHAEATSEKKALALYLDGRVSAVLGTHTHVQTADEQILAGGAAFITDVGMTGPRDSVIGMAPEVIINRFLSMRPFRSEVADGPCQLNAIVVTLARENGKASKIERVVVNMSE